jgi:NAD(P)-dependent dehydrogenase (short-subunit alcohol dehydrogenase family)
MSNSSSARSDKVCFVVGVGEGLGAALAKRFGVGYPVALIARSGEVIGKIGAEIKAAGGAAVPIQSDATVESQIASAHEQISRELGAIEILIFNGGRRPMGRLMETTPEVFEQTWRLHAFGAFLWARQVVPRMLVRGRGTILITGATAGVRP